MSFIKIGDCVSVYEDPITMTKLEGTGRVVDVNDSLSCDEKAFVEVWFDGDDDSGGYFRWIYPANVIGETGHEYDTKSSQA